MNDKATPARPQSAEQFHKTECGIAIPLYAVLDENRQGRQPMPKEILAKVYEFAERWKQCAEKLGAERDGLRELCDELVNLAALPAKEKP